MSCPIAINSTNVVRLKSIAITALNEATIMVETKGTCNETEAAFLALFIDFRAYVLLLTIQSQ